MFRPVEQQVQRPWGWEVPSTQGASKEAQGWMLKVREGLLWTQITSALPKSAPCAVKISKHKTSTNLLFEEFNKISQESLLPGGFNAAGESDAWALLGLLACKESTAS